MKILLQQVLLVTTLMLSLSACTRGDSVINQAQKFENATDYARAAQVYSEGLKSDPDNSEYLWRRAIAFLQNGEIDKTLAYCESHLAKNPDDARAMMLKARCYQFFRFQYLPQRLYKKALALSPSQNTIEEKQLFLFAYGSLYKEKERENIARSILREYRAPGNAREFQIRSLALLSLNRFYEAKWTLKNGIRKYPEAGALHFYLGAIYGKQENCKKCREYLNKAIGFKSNLLWAKAVIGASHYYEGNYQSAIKYFDELLEEYPDYLSLRYLRLDSYAHLKQMDKAEEEMKAILAIEPDNTWAIVNMSTAYSIAGDKYSAGKILNEKLDARPGNVVLSCALANLYSKESETKAALGVLSEAEKKHPESPELHFTRACIYYNLRNYDDARKDIEKAISKDNSDGRYFYRQAEIYRHLEMFKEALSSARVYSRFYPWDLSGKHLLAECYLYSHQYAKALKLADEVLEEEPDRQHTLLTRSVIYGMMGENNKADADLKRCLAAPEQGHDEDYWYCDQGLYYRQLGNYKSAVASLTKAIELNKKNEISWCARGCSYYKMGEFIKAIRDCNESIGLNPDRCHPYLTRGSSYREIGEIDKALTDLNQVISWNPDYGEAFYERSRLFEKRNVPELAKDDLKKSYSLGFRP